MLDNYTGLDYERPKAILEAQFVQGINDIIPKGDDADFDPHRELLLRKFRQCLKLLRKPELERIKHSKY